MKNIAIVGGGPAGAFCAERLLQAGVEGDHITIFDRGVSIENRGCPGHKACNCDKCAILEGFGGAGGMSDGKMTLSLGRGVQTESIFGEEAHRHIDYLRDRFNQSGIPYFEDYSEATEPLANGSPATFSKYPLTHLGSDGIREFIRRQAWELMARGVRIDRSDACQLVPEGVVLRSSRDVYIHSADVVVLATGLSGTCQTEAMLQDAGVPLGKGHAGFGLRFEADAQALEPLFERFYDWKVEMPFEGGVTLRSFCCNRRGWVVNENHRGCGFINVNGHSFLNPRLKTGRSNFAVIAKLPVSDRVGGDPQQFVRSLAKGINQDVRLGLSSKWQSVRSFMQMSSQSDAKGTDLTNRQAVLDWISDEIPGWLADDFRRFLLELNSVAPGLIGDHRSVVYGPEVKYYGYRVPVVGGTWEVEDHPGLYAIGNASGYLDSHIASAVSGLQAAESIAAKHLGL